MVCNHSGIYFSILSAYTERCRLAPKWDETHTHRERNAHTYILSGYGLTAFWFVVCWVTEAVSDEILQIAIVQHVNCNIVVSVTRGIRVEAGEPAVLAALSVRSVLTGARAAITPIVV